LARVAAAEAQGLAARDLDLDVDLVATRDVLEHEVDVALAAVDRGAREVAVLAVLGDDDRIEDGDVADVNAHPVARVVRPLRVREGEDTAPAQADREGEGGGDGCRGTNSHCDPSGVEDTSPSSLAATGAQDGVRPT